MRPVDERVDGGHERATFLRREKLSEGGEKQKCGWLQDKYGLSWQIIPSVPGKLLQDKDAKKAGKVMKAMMQMDKIDIKRLKQAYDQE